MKTLIESILSQGDIANKLSDIVEYKWFTQYLSELVNAKTNREKNTIIDKLSTQAEKELPVWGGWDNADDVIDDLKAGQDVPLLVHIPYNDEIHIYKFTKTRKCAAIIIYNVNDIQYYKSLSVRDINLVLETEDDLYELPSALWDELKKSCKA